MENLCEKFNKFLIKYHFTNEFYNELFIRNIEIKKYDNEEISEIFNKITLCDLTYEKYKKWVNIFKYWRLELLKDNKDFRMLLRFLKENNCYQQFINNVNTTNLSLVNFNEAFTAIISSINFHQVANDNIWVTIQLKWNAIIAQEKINDETINKFDNFIKKKVYYKEILEYYNLCKKSYKVYDFDLTYKGFLLLMMKFPNNTHIIYNNNNVITMNDIVKKFHHHQYIL